MEFRWVALITLWTMVAGPMFDSPSAPARTQRSRAPIVVPLPRDTSAKPMPVKTPRLPG